MFISNPAHFLLMDFKLIGGKKLLLCGSRKSIALPGPDMRILATGPGTGNTFAIYENGSVRLSGHIGITTDAATFEAYKQQVTGSISKIKPNLIISDLHPDYDTTRFGEELAEKLAIPIVKVQHHRAHIYSAAAEHSLDDFIGIACDGLGYGDDGNIWGGEIFDNQKRVGHLEEHYQLGGDSATRFPARMLMSILSKFMDESELRKSMDSHFSEGEFTILQKQLEQRFNCPVTTSTGRVLDAASALLGFCTERTFEGEPAIRLEENSSSPLDIEPVIRGNVLQTTPLFEFLVESQDKGKKSLAATVQQYLAEGLYKIASRYRKQVVFSGGCAYNAIMTSYLLGKGVYVNEKVPCGDGGVSFGQIACYLANSGD